MKLVDQQKKAREFAKRWANTGDEKSESQKFWLDLLENVMGVADPYSYIEFESRIKLDNTSFIDGYIEATHVLIEQKSSNKDLTRPIIQSDGTKLSPFQQAKRYSIELPYSRRPRWIIACNFKEFFIYDMEKPNGEAEIIKLEDLENEVYRLNFIVSEEEDFIKKETQISIEAGEIVASLYDALLSEYQHPDNEASLHSLNILCVRLVFCLYAEDAGLFGNKNMFHDYLNKYKDSNPRAALIDLFKILNQKEEERDPYEDKALLAFPYVNGGLFADMDVEIPRLNPNIVDIILNRASLGFDWSKISPTIFGSVFESTLNPETRRSGGMHYTSIKNIHKVIDPLFLDELKEELAEIKEIDQVRQKKQRLEDLHNKIASLKFLDPAAGSGNFLTETYISLRKLENKIIEEKVRKKDVISISFIDGSSEDLENPIRVNLGQFYGIEINDFAVTVARTALWISEDQMMKETMDIIHQSMDILPLKSYSNIVEGNALTMDWSDLVDKNELDYIMGNPPFVGYKYLSKSQKSELKNLFNNMRSIDYVAGWYNISINYIQETNIKCAFVSTNSIVQGESIQNMWKPLKEKYKFEIDFAHRSFKWSSEASDKASVYCVIIGFSYQGCDKKILFDNGNKKNVEKINPYLVEADFIIMNRTSKPLCNVSKMTKGAQLIDGDNFRLTESEAEKIISKDQNIKPYIYEYLNARNFINRTSADEKEYCLYLVNCPPNLINKNSAVKDRVRRVKEYRENSSAETTRRLANEPTLFFQKQVPENKNIVVPVVSSEKRKYIPMDFMSPKVVYTNALFFVDNADIYEFGVLMSNVHMGWMRVFAGRLKTDYRYSNTLVYNTFPWPNPTEEQREKIEKTAQLILDTRALYPESSLADLYNDLIMPKELRKAHILNDKIVMESYGFDWRYMTESECVAELMKMYEKLVNKEKS